MAKRLLALVLAAAIALSVGVTFRPQAAQAATNPVTAMSVATQPQLAYVEMNTLDLSGLSVTLIYSDTTTATVGFADLAANGVTLAYSNGWLATQGDMLTVAGFNGLTIVLTCGKVTAETGALAVTVNSAYDVNGDGKVDAADLALIMANLNKKATASAAAKKCDVNGSGTVDTLDYALVANYIAGVSGAATPEPAPTPEPDILAESIAIDPETVSLQVDETTQLMAVFTPADTTDQSVTWASSDDAKATVDADGLVTAVAATDADAPVIITATATASGLTATCEVTVTAPEPDTSEWIPVAKAMVQGDIYAVDPAGKFKLFDEYDKVVAAPPDSANPYLPPVNTGAAVNDNVWRSAGANWDVQYETYFTINFGTQCELTNIWVYDGPSYAPATYVHPDTVDKPYEVYGGQFQVWSGALDTGTLLGTVTIENVGQWKDIDLTGLNADGYLTTDTLSFRKVQDTVNNRYAWSGGNWTSDAGQYVCDVCVPEVAIKGTPLGTLTTDPVVDNDWTPTPDGRTPTVFDLDMRDLIGTNGFFTDNQDNYSP
ncbi:MAG: Ig-like domain-containing protein, partial [Defluviitaleaceae bacterium]|nr:Ig-like domain-containing protein [Defluviitaleaceae bacterium]